MCALKKSSTLIRFGGEDDRYMQNKDFPMVYSNLKLPICCSQIRESVLCGRLGVRHRVVFDTDTKASEEQATNETLISTS